MNGIRHTGIYVKDIEKMTEFYQNIFDLEIVVRQKEYGAYTDMIFHEENVEIDVCKLKFKSGTMIELISYCHRDDCPDWNEKIYQCGKMHIAITVDSAKNMYENLKGQGCVLMSNPCDAPDGKARVFFARDPEGNYLEIVEEL